VSSEDTILGLIKFVSETGRLPRPDEPGLKGLVNSANQHFGSLENALRMAGLLTPNARTAHRIRARQHSLTRAQAKPSTWSTYPKDYFLNLLNLQRKSHSNSPTPIGTPIWWERRANMQYTCSTCKRIIEKGEKYIGYRKLNPGMRGIYGYRGTYATHYYHIFCLLKKAKSEVETNIRGSHSEIDSIEKAIVDFTEEMSRKRAQVEECRTIIRQARKDYVRRTLWGRVGKWFGLRYISWSKGREISRLEKEIAYIENREVPERKTRITRLTGRIEDFQQQLNEIDKRLQELVSRRQTM
jgi:hypothetical protein